MLNTLNPEHYQIEVIARVANIDLKLIPEVSHECYKIARRGKSGMLDQQIFDYILPDSLKPQFEQSYPHINFKLSPDKLYFIHNQLETFFD